MVKTALIVDDSRLARLTLKRLLMKYEIEVSEAEGVLDAERWITHNMLPDIIFMDIMMPDLDGYDGLARLRQDPDTRDVPVIMYSGDISEESRRKARDGGATGYLPKPADASRLDHLLNALKTRVRQDLPSMPEKAPEKPAAPAASTPRKPAEAPRAVVPPVQAQDFASYVTREIEHPRSPEPVYQPEVARETLEQPSFDHARFLAQNAETEALRQRLETLEIQVGAQMRSSNTTQKDNVSGVVLADIERLRRDVGYLQQQNTKLEQRAGLATMIASASLIMAILSILWHFVR